jgi:hypothetical protein
MSLESTAASSAVTSLPRRVESIFYDEVSASFIIILHIFFCFPQRGPQPRDFGFALPNYPPKIFFDHHHSFHEATAQFGWHCFTLLPRTIRNGLR